MEKTIGLITEDKNATYEYNRQLHSIFGETIKIINYSVNDCLSYKIGSEEILLSSAYSSSEFFDFKENSVLNKMLMPINLCLSRKNLIILNAYPKGTKALLVNVSKFTAEETITQLYQAGYSNIKFVPYYQGCNVDENIKLAITPGEIDLIPDFVTEVIDIEPRQIDIMNIVEISIKLNYEYILETNSFFDFFEMQLSNSKAFSIIMDQNRLLSQSLSTLLQSFEGGVIKIDENGEIQDCNYNACNMINKNKADILSLNANDIFINSALESCKNHQIIIKSSIILETEKPLNGTLIPITIGTKHLGLFAIVDQSHEKLDAASKLLSASNKKGHIAKYSFKDICGKSAETLQTIHLAKKMARTDSSIIITGESGSGKELFAHAIHKASTRSDGPFVAINCAALPVNLLESELFGYEEGSFTGAKKGGKIGLFEMANNGTVFLDELEGMDKSTQLKLLRVIQEREIMRIGGDRIIPINVRIISASNQDLLPLTNSGEFRKDLFYRVCTLPLEVPPLRNRKSDILILVEEFKKDLNLNFTLTDEVQKILKAYSWPGNIRELRNCIEYLGCHNIPVVETEHLPFMLRCNQSIFKQNISKNINKEILSILIQKSQGRNSIINELSKLGINISEGELRGILKEFKNKNWISSNAGRKGTSLTSEGINEYNKILSPN